MVDNSAGRLMAVYIKGRGMGIEGIMEAIAVCTRNGGGQWRATGAASKPMK